MKTTFEIYIHAINNHEVKRALSYFSNDFQLHFVGTDYKIDKEGMVDILGWDKGVNGEVQYGKLEIKANSIVAIFTEKNNFFRLMGIDSLQSKNTFIFNEMGLIEKQVYKSLPDQLSFLEKMQSVVAWAKKNHPEELEAIFPNEQMQFNEEMGRRWVALLKQWKGID